MDLLVPTVEVLAQALQEGDIVVEHPRGAIEPFHGRRLVKGVEPTESGNHVTVWFHFPSMILCIDGCEADPRTCTHYGQGGRGDLMFHVDTIMRIVAR